MKTRLIALLLGMPLLILGTSASAQSGLTCSDIDFTSDMRAKYSDIDEACLDVVNIDGRNFAKMKVELVRSRGNNAYVRLLHRDGRKGPTHRANIPPSWRAEIDGRSYRLNQLGAGQELDVYLPPDRFEAHFAAPETTVVTYVGYELVEDDGADAGNMSSASLPATASPLFTMGALGGSALFMAFLIRLFRRQRA